MNVEELSAEQLVVLAKQGEATAKEGLYLRYKKTVRSIANSFFLIGGEKEDLLQEGTMGLLSAVDDYDSDKGSFSAFARLCIRRRMLTAISKENNGKNTLLLSALPLDEHIVSSSNDPLEIVLDRDLLQSVRGYIEKNLTSSEQQTLSLYLQGFSYQEISSQTRKSLKSVDAALQRAKKKISLFKE